MSNRVIVYPGQTQKSTDFLQSQLNYMEALGGVLSTVVGTGTFAAGLVCGPTSPASLTVTVGPGVIIAPTVVDTTAFGGIAANSSPLLKMGQNLTSTSFTLTAPTVSGQSINYLIEATFEEIDGTPLELSYYNAVSPTTPYTGPGGDGVAQNTTRSQIVGLQLKAGAAANSGSQATPGADVGWSPLWVITVNYGQTQITAANIATATNAPFIAGGAINTGRLLGVQRFASSGTYHPTTGTNSIIVELVGGGAGGGGGASTSSGQIAVGGGGGAGGYAKGNFVSGFTGQIVTVGAAGSGGAAGNNAGASGGMTSFMSMSATGGSGGAGCAAAPPPYGVSGGSGGFGAGGSILNSVGQFGGFSTALATLNGGSGAGGSSQFGAGGQPAGTLSSSFAGVNASSPGAGGSGGANGPSLAAVAGGSGAAGLVLIWEYS